MGESTKALNLRIDPRIRDEMETWIHTHPGLSLRELVETLWKESDHYEDLTFIDRHVDRTAK